MVRLLKYLGPFVVVACAAAGVALTRHHWLPSETPAPSEISESDTAGHVALPNEQVQLSAQAQKNLGMTSEQLQATAYWRAIEIPGTIVDRPGVSDRGVVAPVTGVVSAIHHHAGDTVEAEKILFTLRLVDAAIQSSQAELFKATKDREIAQEHIDRLGNLAQTGAVANVRLIELRNEIRRLEASINAARQNLQVRGLTTEQINAIAEGDFVLEVSVRAPRPPVDQQQTLARSRLPHSAQPLAGLTRPEPTALAAGLDATVDGQGGPEASADGSRPEANADGSRVFEVQDVAVELGQQVQVGKKLCTLSDHQYLFVEGRAFRPELPLLQKAAEASLPIDVELVEKTESDWDGPVSPLVIHHISNTLDEHNRTVSFFLPLVNQHRTYERNGQTLFIWRFRPGQRVRLRMNVEQLSNVFVLPAAAVVREGPEFYVFRRNGDLFDRKPVHVVYRTQEDIVIANDGSIPPGIHVAQTGAVQLNRVLKSQSGSAPSGMHVHADGSVHSSH